MAQIILKLFSLSRLELTGVRSDGQLVTVRGRHGRRETFGVRDRQGVDDATARQ